MQLGLTMLVPLSEIFNFKNGTSSELINCDVAEHGIPFISRTSENNGVVAHVCELDNLEPLLGNCITVALGGSVLSSFYQPKPFYTSFHIQCLYPKIELNQSEMLFYCAAIEANKYRYSYGRQANKTLKDIRVPAPADIPSSIKHYHPKKTILTNAISAENLKLFTENWESYTFKQLFHVIKGKRLTKQDMLEGEIRFIGSTEFNNGITTTVANDENLHEGNLITVAYNGSVAEAFYQPSPFVASDDINILKPKNFILNQYIAMFLITVISNEKYRFSYGRKWHKEKMESSKLKLPSLSTGEPDWAFMEQFIKSLPYSSNL
jgi:hypothetical protein